MHRCRRQGTQPARPPGTARPAPLFFHLRVNLFPILFYFPCDSASNYFFHGRKDSLNVTKSKEMLIEICFHISIQRPSNQPYSRGPLPIPKSGHQTSHPNEALGYYFLCVTTTSRSSIHIVTLMLFTYEIREKWDAPFRTRCIHSFDF